MLNEMIEAMMKLSEDIGPHGKMRWEQGCRWALRGIDAGEPWRKPDSKKKDQKATRNIDS